MVTPKDMALAYATAHEEHDPDKVAALFADDGVVVAGADVTEGRDAIRESMAASLAGIGDMKFKPTRFQEKGENEVTMYWVGFIGEEVLLSGHDDFLVVDGKIKRLEITFDPTVQQ